MKITRRAFLRHLLAGSAGLAGARLWAAGGGRVSADEVTTPLTITPWTPYDAGYYVWHWKGDAVQSDSIDEFAATQRRIGQEAVNGVFIKTFDGEHWQGDFDTKAALAVTGTDSLRAWVDALDEYALECHAWGVVKGLNVEAEAQRIIDTLQVAGVRSVILDVEAAAGFWQGSADDVDALMQLVRATVGDGTHIGILVDPRQVSFDAIYPDRWRPHVDSVHLQVYWDIFRQSPDETLAEAYATWQPFGLPLVPAMSGDGDAQTLLDAVALAADSYSAPAISWWRAGAIPSENWAALIESKTAITQLYG